MPVDLKMRDELANLLVMYLKNGETSERNLKDWIMKYDEILQEEGCVRIDNGLKYVQNILAACFMYKHEADFLFCDIFSDNSLIKRLIVYLLSPYELLENMPDKKSNRNQPYAIYVPVGQNKNRRRREKIHLLIVGLLGATTFIVSLNVIGILGYLVMGLIFCILYKQAYGYIEKWRQIRINKKEYSQNIDLKWNPFWSEKDWNAHKGILDKYDIPEINSEEAKKYDDQRRRDKNIIITKEAYVESIFSGLFWPLTIWRLIVDYVHPIGDYDLTPINPFFRSDAGRL